MARKDFTKNNPAMAYITPQQEMEAIGQDTKDRPKKQLETKTETTPEEPPKGYKLNPQYIEKKSQRVNLLIQPSVLKRLKKMAKKNKVSVNEQIHQIIIEELEREGF
jgi:predicted HicB family RNase H-like nuclease